MSNSTPKPLRKRRGRARSFFSGQAVSSAKKQILSEPVLKFICTFLLSRTGFIGGASGNDGANTYFCGNIDLHPDGEAIKSFCKAHGRPAVSLGANQLYDVGTIFFI